MTNKEFFYEANREADLTKQKIMIDTFNMLNGTNYFIMCNRVTYEEIDENGVKHFHDAWVNA